MVIVDDAEVWKFEGLFGFQVFLQPKTAVSVSVVNEIY